MLSSLFNPKRLRNVVPWTAESNEGSNYASCARFCYLKRCITPFVDLLKKLKLFSHQLNFENSVQILLSEIIFRHWNCFLLSVATDCKDGNGL